MRDKPVNVLALSYLFPNRSQPGYGIFVLNRLRAVAESCNVRVIAPVQWYPFIHRMRRDLWGENIPEQDVREGLQVLHPRFAVIPRYFKWIDALTYLWAAHRMAKRLRKREFFDYDLVDVHWTYPDIVAGWFLARTRGKRYVVTVRGHEALYDTELSLRRWLVAAFLRRADQVVTLSSELRDKVVALGVPADRVRVVLNGVDIERFEYMEPRVARAELGLDPQRRILLSVGRLTAGKGHDTLIKMMPALSKEHDIELFIIGGVNAEDDYGDVIRRLIRDLGLRNVHLVDKVPHESLRLWYAAADLFCLATRSEGCPNVLLEALACGSPVVVSKVGAVADIVRPEVNGFMVERSDSGCFEAQVRRALAHRWDRRSIAWQMAERGWSTCAKEVLRVYAAAMNSC